MLINTVIPVCALFCFVVASYVYILRQFSGFITSLSSAEPVDLYFLSSENSSVSVNIKLICDDTDFNGNVKVSLPVLLFS